MDPLNSRLNGTPIDSRVQLQRSTEIWKTFPVTTPEQLLQSLQAAATALEFDMFGICPAVEPTGFSRLLEWLDRKYHGEMAYFEKRRAAYATPAAVLDRVASLIVLGMRYAGCLPRPTDQRCGHVASYAAAPVDYHEVIWRKLDHLGQILEQAMPGARWRGVVDTAPLLEREFAQLAGLGWAGKNTMLINPKQGSYFFLAAILVDRELPYSQPFAADHCGTCRRCLEACPTNAFVEPHVLDARRCISYLTIEHRSAIPVELRPGLGDWLFGCDVCQDVCPWNRFAQPPSAVEFAGSLPNATLDLVELLRLDDDGFRQRFRKTPLWRARRRGLLRNACIVAANSRCAAAVPELIRLLADAEPLLRGAAAWGLAHFPAPSTRAALQGRLHVETDDEVRAELLQALEMMDRSATAEPPSPAESQ